MMEDFNLPRPVRFVIYVSGSLANILVTYLNATKQIGSEATIAFGAAITFALLLAGFNTRK